MARIELTIDASYLPEWGAWHGIRELVSNGKDAETELHAPLRVEHRGTRLIVENDGAALPHKALLFGATTKAGRSDTIGRFGEGLKLGILALVRAGMKVVIRSGAETWTPAIERSERFEADVLVFNVRGGNQYKERVRIEVDGIDKETWQDLRKRFLFVHRPKQAVSTSYGTLLRDEDLKGKVFVKGIYVQEDSRLNAGYDFNDGVTIDRDRKMVASWDLQWRTQQIWSEALVKDGGLLMQFVELADKDAEDLRGVSEHSVPCLPKRALNAIAQAFTGAHGATAVPCKDMNESRDVEHLGVRGVVVSKTMATLLQPIVGDADAAKARLKNAVIQRYSWGELTADERDNLDWAAKLVRAAATAAQVDVRVACNVVDFRDDGLMGLFSNGGDIDIARKLLADRYEVLATLLHEVAHHRGHNGDHGHVATLEKLWTQVARELVGVLP